MDPNVNVIIYQKGLCPWRLDCPIPGCDMVGFAKDGSHGWYTLGRHLYFDHGIQKKDRAKWIRVAPHSHNGCQRTSTAHECYQNLCFTHMLMGKGKPTKIDEMRIFHNETRCSYSNAPLCVCRFGQNTLCKLLDKKK